MVVSAVSKTDRFSELQDARECRARDRAWPKLAKGSRRYTSAHAVHDRLGDPDRTP
jgi:hypothetical protein